ncbi:hypothetical protein M8J77_020471 [Diaphorina citri]|nr:hypothetical protein M8J77_020471 [Diaphorina citri]
MRTATGHEAPVYGEVKLDTRLGSVIIPHTYLLADIVDECILGLDFLNEHDISINFCDKIMTLGEVEIPLTLGSAETGRVYRTYVTETTSLAPLSETVVWTRLNESPVGQKYFLVEPEPVKGEMMTARTLVSVNERNMVPVRVMNLSKSKIKLKEGETLGTCEPVTEVLSLDKVTPPCTTRSKEEKGFVDQLLRDCKLEPSDMKSAKVLLSEFIDVFALNEDDNGRTSLVQHRIDTGDTRPIRQPARRLPLAKQAEVAEMIETMKRQGVIEESASPWSSPVVLVSKKGGGTRFCMDYRKLNDVTRKDSYPLPRIDDTLDMLSGAHLFSTLDMKSGYWQVELHPKDKEKTAFTVSNGLWHFNVLPFGLCNSPATFERLMDCVLRGLTWKTCLVYLDDIIVIGKTFQEHVENLKAVFLRLRSAHLKLGPKKCNLFRTEVKYLGHIVSADGVKTDPDKIEAVKSWPVPKDKHEVRSFLGLATYYRRFIKGFADIARCLHRLTEKGRQFVWTEECGKSFEALKRELSQAPVLHYPVPGKPFVLDTDASNTGIGAVLSQINNGSETPVAYFSRALSKPERNYCVTRKELLGLVAATKHFHKYLYGQKFTLRTDHASLKWLLQFKNPEGQIARWIEQLLQSYDFEIKHRAGKSHSNADAFSRRPCKPECKHCARVEEREVVTVRRVTVEPDAGWTEEELEKEQREDPDLGPVIEYKERDVKPLWRDVSDLSEAAKSYIVQWDSLVLESGVLKRRWESLNGRNVRLQIILPRARVKEVLEELHGGTSGGHLGVNKTVDKVRERFYWLRMKQDVEDYCRRCASCAASKGPRVRSRGELQKYLRGGCPVRESGDGYRRTVPCV